LTIGSDEWSTGEVKLKDFSVGTEERVLVTNVAARLKKSL
jgi:hypothetical protein